MNRHAALPVQPQLGLRDPADRLATTTFVVFDTETTGGSPETDAITELGAVKVRGGEVLGTFHTLVHPGRDIPPTITFLTGISESLVAEAPSIEDVLPTFLAFLGPESVLVGHNVRFDVGFLAAACDRTSHPVPALPSVDTVSLAKRLLRDEVPDLKLGTLARHLRLPHKPSHRALDDAWATVDLLHALLERAGSLGVHHLDDLLELPTLAGHPDGQKLRWVEHLPRSPGVYLFRDRDGTVLYVGKAVDLRRRVRQYFGGDDRRKIPQLLRQAARLDHQTCATELEAAVLEARLIQQLRPRFNSAGTRAPTPAWVRLDLTDAFPRLSVVRSPKAGAGPILGPLPSSRAAQQAIEAIWEVSRLRRCADPLGRRPPSGVPVAVPGRRPAPCGPAQLGVAACPCAGADRTEAEAYDDEVRRVRRGLEGEPDVLLGPLRRRLTELAGQRRFEDAASLRDRASALAGALERQARLDRLHRAGRVVVEVAGEGGCVLDHGLFVEAWAGDQRPATLDLDPLEVDDAAGRQGLLPLEVLDALGEAGGLGAAAVPADRVAEALLVARWLEARLDRLVVVGRPLGVLAAADTLERFRPIPAKSPASAARRRAEARGETPPGTTGRRRKAPPSPVR